MSDKQTATPEERFEVLRSMASTYLSKDDIAFLEKAFTFARGVHAGQLRKSGEPFVLHPVEVAIILADLRMDVETLAAALLHDTVEDTDTTSEQVAELFNEQVSQLVDGVTKITRIEVESLSEKQALTIRKMFVAMSKDIRVIVIKLADRLHNMRTLGALKEDRRIFKARETMEIYAPIAHRLGINNIKWELEDLSFFYLEPHKYKQIRRMLHETREEREAYVSEVMQQLTDEMERVNIDAQIMGRPKHLWSIYRKMSSQDKGFSEIYDLIAVRIIVPDVKDCYSALGAVHTLWHPMPGRFKDYIAMPKYNMYQSLHTTVLGPASRPLEVQIRTEEMHHTSEYGVAAHWRYKEQGNSNPGKPDAMDSQLAWLRQMVDWQDETQDSREFLKSLKVDLAPTEVFVFTPSGEVISLRAGSTPIDFAYTIHTEVGNHCVGAKVNGAIVPLSYKLQVGDRVEILTMKTGRPSRDWLNLVKTPGARSKIRSYFAKVSRGDDIQLGRDKLTREMRKHDLGIASQSSVRAIKAVAEAMGFNDPDDMYVQIGTGKESVQSVANRILRELGHEDAPPPTRSHALGVSDSSTGVKPPMLTTVKKEKKDVHASNGVVVRGLDDGLVRLSKCCNPVPGDEIIGFVTRGRGVSVHRADCPNAEDLKKDAGRIIDVAWESAVPEKTSFKVDIAVIAVDRMGLLADVVVALSEMGANVVNSSTITQRDETVNMRFLIQVSDTNSIERILNKLHKIEGVFDAHRVSAKEASNKKKK